MHTHLKRMVLDDSHNKRRNCSVAWIDYGKSLSQYTTFMNLLIIAHHVSDSNNIPDRNTTPQTDTDMAHPYTHY